MSIQEKTKKWKLNKGFALITMLVLLASLVTSFNLGTGIGQASVTIRRVPTDYPTIQAGIDAALSGDVVLVDAGTYYENITIGKALSLVGQNKETTIIDGNGIGKVVVVTASHVNLTGFTVRHSGQSLKDSGIFLDFRSTSSWISSNNVINNYHGIFVEYSTGNIISFNNVSSNTGRGINLVSSSENTISSNSVSRNEQDNGIELFDSTGNLIAGNTVSRNGWGGIYLSESSNNIIKENSVSNNSVTGVYLDRSSNNVLFRNNMFYNGLNELGQLYTADSLNSWDNRAEGNYWSDYSGADQDGDGIGDTGTLPHLQVDQKPLVEPWSLLRVFFADGKTVTVSSNSTIARFTFLGLQAEINFNATGAPGVLSFSNVTIPKALINASPPRIWTILVDGAYYSHNMVENLTHTSLYFTYSHSVRHIKIQVVELPNIPPTANFAYSPINPTVNDVVDFHDSSTDDDGTIALWRWQFGDGANSTAQHPQHKYAVAGAFTVTLKVTDDRGAETLTSKGVSVRRIGTSVMVDAPSEVNRGELFTILVTLRDESQNPMANTTVWIYMLQEKWNILDHAETNASGMVSFEYGTELQPGTQLFKAMFNGTQIFGESSNTFQVIIKASNGAPPSTAQLNELLLRIGVASAVIGIAIALIILWRRRRVSPTRSLKDAKK